MKKYFLALVAVIVLVGAETLTPLQPARAALATGEQCVCTATDGSGETQNSSAEDATDCIKNRSGKDWSCVVSSTISAGNGSGNLQPYVPLEPLPGFIPTDQTDLSRYINLLFKVIIAAGAIIAVGTLVFSGIVYMVSGAVGTKSVALKRIQASIWGLLLLIASWLLLYTINPRLVGQNANETISATPTTNNPSTAGAYVPAAGERVLYANDQNWNTKYTQLCPSGNAPFKQRTSNDSNGVYSVYTCP